MLGPASAAVSPSPVAPALSVRDAVERLQVWLAQYGDKGDYLPSSLEKNLNRLLKDVGQTASGRSAGAPAARLLLLESAGWGLFDGKPATLSATIRSAAQAVLETRLAPGRGDAFADWILYDLLSSGDRHEPLVRIVALRALGKRADARGGKSDIEKLLVGIMSAGRDRDPMVRQTASDMLEGRTEAFVSDYFLSSLERETITPEVFMSHLDALGQAAPKDREAWWQSKRLRVFEYVTNRLQDPDWREASRGLALARAFELKRIAPYLIEGLGVWSQRTTPGKRRIVHEYATALAQLSGRDYGENVATWARWWQASTKGGASPEAAETQATGSFFGLQPVSDHILFVIDRSGSMRTFFDGKTTRYKESIDRLIYTLRDLGPSTQFNVVLFSNGGVRFSKELEQADDETLKRLEDWALKIGPGGGTDLHSGIRAGLPGLEIGTTVASSIPFDTVVVLCDGETEDPGWVAPWLAEYNQTARLLFHCVNIGGTPGGVLKALATGSGGALIVSK